VPSGSEEDIQMTNPVLDFIIKLNGAPAPLDWLQRTSENLGTGTLYGLDLPPVPDRAVAVLRYEGRAPDETYGNPFAVRHPRLQVTVRDVDSNFCFDTADQIIKYMSVKDEVINGTKYQRIKPVTEPTELGPDSSGRQRVTINFEVSFEDSL